MSKTTEMQLLIQVSKKFYINQKSKTTIAKELDISRFKVARLLKRAVDENIVKVEIADTFNTRLDLSEQIEEKFGLKTAIVVKSEGIKEDEALNEIMKECANFLASIFHDGSILGIVCGTTTLDIANKLPKLQEGKNRSKVIQIAGGIGQLENEQAYELLSMMGKKLNADVKTLLAPVIVSLKESKEIIFKDESICTGKQYFDKINIAITGIGSFEDKKSTMYKIGNFSEEDYKRVEEKQVVGDVFMHLFNQDGEIVDYILEDRIMNIDTKNLLKIPLKIGLMSKGSTTNAVRCALKTKLINILIIDEKMANELLLDK